MTTKCAPDVAIPAIKLTLSTGWSKEVHPEGRMYAAAGAVQEMGSATEGKGVMRRTLHVAASTT